jgi:hypothetical protein
VQQAAAQLAKEGPANSATALSNEFHDEILLNATARAMNVSCLFYPARTAMAAYHRPGHVSYRWNSGCDKHREGYVSLLTAVDLRRLGERRPR